jgi:hypothetical protein
MLPPQILCAVRAELNEQTTITLHNLLVYVTVFKKKGHSFETAFVLKGTIWEMFLQNMG